MSVLWADAPLSAGQVIARLAGVAAWSPKTVKTLLARLVKKGHLAHTSQGREYVYRPLVERHACLRREARSFLKRFFSSAVSPLVAELIEGDELSDADLEELRRLLARRGARRKRSEP